MYKSIEQKSEKITYIQGSRRISNFFWAISVTIGGLGFFLRGISSYFNVDFLLFSKATEISFIPQGIVLLFYGTVGSILSIFLWLTIWWDVGVGYNSFNKEKKLITLYRKGLPGKEIFLNFSFEEVKSIKMLIKEGLNPRRQLFLCLVDKRNIPIIGIDQPIALNKIETEALLLAKYLNVYLETE